MGTDELVPHLNKISTLYLKNNKRKVGWIFCGKSDYGEEENIISKVYFISIQKGKKLLNALQDNDQETLGRHCEAIPIDLIERIRSSK